MRAPAFAVKVYHENKKNISNEFCTFFCMLVDWLQHIEGA